MKKKLLAAITMLSVVMFFTPLSARAASITLDGTVVSNEYSTSTITQAITIGANSDRMLIVAYGSYQGGGPSGITYNGVALTKIVEQVGSFNEVSSLWGLVAPATGTNNIVVSGAGNWSAMGAWSLYNVDQTLPATFSSGGGESSTASLALTTTVDGAWVITSIESEPVPTVTTSGGVNSWSFEGASYQHASGHTVPKATAGSQTMSASLSYGARWNMTNVQIKPVAAAAAAAPLPTVQINGSVILNGQMSI